jgi:alpha-L-fucosidase
MASITVYTERDYGGESALLAPGGYNSEKLQELGIAIGSISSNKVPKGIKVVAYSKDSYGGTAWKITDNSPNLADTGNDNAIVSLIIVGQ